MVIITTGIMVPETNTGIIRIHYLVYRSFFKRLLDVTGALSALVLLLIPLLLIAIILKIDCGESVLFLQYRSGKNRSVFRIWKFRTMSALVDDALPTRECSHGDGFMTSFQRFLRRSSIDELPQLVNILKGEMSFVGPRPVICQETALLDERDRYDANALRPGLTGWAQVNGRDNLDDAAKARLDGEYVERLSFIFDFKCIMTTLVRVIRHDGFNDNQV